MCEAYLYSITQGAYSYCIITVYATHNCPTMYLRMPIFRVWSADRTIKKAVVSTPEIETLKNKGKKIIVYFVF